MNSQAKAWVRAQETARNVVATINGRLLLIVALALALRVWFLHGFFPSDQYFYCRNAMTLAGGQWYFTPDDDIATRWAIIAPMAICYRLFGINEFGSTLWSMVCSLGTVMVAYRLGRHLKNEHTGILAAALIAVFPLEIIYAGQAMADGPLSFWLLLTLYWFVVGQDRDPIRARRYFFMSGFGLAMVYATKQVAAIIVFPFFIIACIVRPAMARRLTWMAGSFGLMLAFEYVVYQILTDNGLHRLSVVFKVAADRADQAATGSLNELTSMGAYLYWMFVDIHYVGLSFIVLIVALATTAFQKSVDSGPNTRAWRWLVIWSGLLVLILTFQPLSIRPYVPVFKLSSYMLMFTAPLLTLLALLISRMSRRAQYLCMSLIAVSCLPSVYLSRESHRAHVDNARAVYSFYKMNRDRPIYACSRMIMCLEYFDDFRNEGDYRNYGSVSIKSEAAQGAFIVVDDYFTDYYRGRRGAAEPISANVGWRRAYRYHRSGHWLRRESLRMADILQKTGLMERASLARLERKLAGWSHSKPVNVYATD